MPKSKEYKTCAICEHTSAHCTCRSLTVGSVFSGIGGFDLGLERAGMEVVWQVEINPFRRRILGRHWPDVERFEDVRDISYIAETDLRQQSDAAKTRGDLSRVDLLCGGFPCQDLSVAGRRGGIRAERSGLFFEFARLAGELRPDWLLIENVPGLLSSNQGADFEAVLETLSELGYAVAWRILDSRYFGVPQRRRRVYIVGHIRADCAAAVLFEPEGGTGDTEKGGEKGEGVAYALTGSPGGTGDGHGNAWNTTYIPELTGVLGNASGKRGWKISAEDAADGKLIVGSPSDCGRVREATGIPRRVDPQPLTGDVAYALAERNRKGISLLEPQDTLVAAPLETSDGHHGYSSPRGDGADNLVTAPLRGRSSSEGVNPPGRGGEDDENVVTQPLVVSENQRAEVKLTEYSRQLTSGGGKPGQGYPAVLEAAPREDGLDGAEEDIERPPRAPKPCCPDGPRYAALGDAVTTNVVEWIGRRMMIVEESMRSLSGR